MAETGHVYHWKHGWIPLDHTDAHSHDVGIRSRQDVAKAVRDLPNVPVHDRPDVRRQLTKGADEHNAQDLLPGPLRSHALPAGSGVSAVGKASRMSAADVKVGAIVQAPGLGGKTHRLRVDKVYPTRSDGSRNVDVTNLATGKTSEITLEGNGKMHSVERA